MSPRVRYTKTQRRNNRLIIRSDGAVFASLKDASVASEVGTSGISLALNGRQRTAGGYGWKFLDTTDDAAAFEIRGDRRYQVVVRSDGQIFASASDAISHASVPASTFYRHMRAGEEIAGHKYERASEAAEIAAG